MNEELVAAIAASLVSSGPLSGKKHFQKLFYLIEKSEVPTDLDFEMHYYGPYSFALAGEMSRLEHDDVLRVSDGKITAGENANRALSYFADELKPFESQVRRVVDAFRDMTPKRLELLATTHLAAERLTQLGKSTKSADLVGAVRTEKGKKFSDQEIVSAIGELRKHHLLRRVE